MDTKLKIIEQADHLFQQFGFRSVTMDDIAKSLGLSKKTLYQYFKDKDEIVIKATEHHLKSEFEEFKQVGINASNAIDEIVHISICIRRNLHKTNPSILFDLQKFHPSAWQLFLDYKENVFKQNIINTIRRGQSEGWFRQELDAEMLAILRLEQIQMSFDAQVFPPSKYNFKEIQNQFIDHFIHGLLTEDGRKKYHETLKLKTETSTQ